MSTELLVSILVVFSLILLGIISKKIKSKNKKKSQVTNPPPPIIDSGGPEVTQTPLGDGSNNEHLDYK